MKTTPVLRAAAIVSAAAALLALSYGGVAHAITESIFRYNNPKTGYFSIGPMALAPDSDVSATRYTVNSPLSAFPSAAGVTCFVSGINLPNNAQIKTFSIWYSSDANSSVVALLYRSNPANGSANELGRLTSSDTSQSRLALTLPIPASAATTVNNLHFNYGLRVCLSTVLSSFYGARVTYTYADAGD